jgi:hypothetical protein
MSLTANQLTNKNAVFNEWIAKYPELKTYTQQGLARTLSADDLLGFTAPDAAWLNETKQQRARSGQAGKPTGSQTSSTYTVQFDATSGNADKNNWCAQSRRVKKVDPVQLILFRCL